MNKKQIAVIIGSIILIVLLLFANNQLPKKVVEVEVGENVSEASTSVKALVDIAQKGLNADQKEVFVKLEEELTKASDKAIVYKKIIDQWSLIRQPIPLAYYSEQLAIAVESEINWEDAGNRYYSATRFVKSEENQLLFKKAIDCFEKTLNINPNNINAKINLASCYVEGSSEPMKGIGMLREVEKIDSNNVNLQLSFAFFSEKSGQWDKAIARFEKILKIKPDFIEAYLHLADAYDRKGDKVKVIENLEKYFVLVKDEGIKEEIRNYINKLKTN